MSVDRHGVHKDQLQSASGDLAPNESGRGSLVENFEKETIGSPFKGFRKVPTVVLPRFDITPYLKNMTSIHESNSNTQSPIDFPSSTIDDRFFKCKVKLFRDDLENMKETSTYPERLYTCKICKKQYPGIKKLRNHHDNKHLIVYGPLKPPKRVSFSEKVIVHELLEYHECRKCTKIFESYMLLKKHMKQNHKKRKCYICHYCSKKFVDRSIFKVHIKLHCDVCGDLSPTKLKYLEHRRYVCKVYKMHKCPTCELAFYRFIDLKDHSYDHIGNYFICDICKDQFSSKCAVAHHIQFLHSKRRPKSLFEMRLLGSDRVYLCNFCDESSVDKTSIENHVELLPDLSNRAMTGYKDYYFCDQCLKQFSKENEMLQHKWTHFLKEKPETEKIVDSVEDSTDSDGDKNKFIDLKEKSETEKIVDSVEDSTDSDEDKNKSIEKNESDSQIPDSTQTVKQTPKYFDLTKEIPTTMLPKVIVKRLSTDILEKKENKNNDAPILLSCLTSTPMNNNNKPETIVDISTETQIEKESDVHVVNEQVGGEILLSNKPLVINKKTIVSKHLCDICNKYFSTAYCLRRHVEQMHRDYENLRCRDCEETFVWPSLLLSHNCLRAPVYDEPFDDARPEILFDNIPRMSTDSLENCVDFDIPAPIVELSPEQNMQMNMNGPNGLHLNGQTGVMSSPSGVNFNGTGVHLNAPSGIHLNGPNGVLNGTNVSNVSGGSGVVMNGVHKGYRIVVQEVPIEF